MKQFVALLCAALVSVAATAGPVDEALSHPDRSDTDKALDAKRKPAMFIDFLGIEQGMSVIDIFAGGGYYTEIVSRLVGEDGFVTLYNNSPWDRFVGEAVDKRLSGDRLPNVDRLVAPPEDLIDLPDKYDVAIFVLGMHDIYYTDEENGWPAIDKERFLKGIYNVVADGGVLGVIDHNARPGTDPEVVGEELHRIDPAIIIEDLEDVGFEFEAQADFLRNPEDDLTVNVFDDSIRRRTDRSVLKFRK